MQVGDVGATITVTINQDGSAMDISTSTDRNIYLRSPSGTVTNHTAVFVGDGSDGQIRYTTTDAGDVGEQGQWDLQADVVMPAGTFRTSTTTFKVDPNL